MTVAKNPKMQSGLFYAKKKQEILERLYNESPNCRCCGKHTFINIPNTTEMLHNRGTIEHLYHKLDIRRFLISPLDYLTLYCSECNNNANMNFHLSISNQCQTFNITAFIQYPNFAMQALISQSFN